MTVEPPVLYYEDQITLEASAQQVWDAIKDYGCTVRWCATFHGPDPQSGSADEFDPTDAVKGIFGMGLENLQAVVGV